MLARALESRVCDRIPLRRIGQVIPDLRRQLVDVVKDLHFPTYLKVALEIVRPLRQEKPASAGDLERARLDLMGVTGPEILPDSSGIREVQTDHRVLDDLGYFRANQRAGWPTLTKAGNVDTATSKFPDPSWPLTVRRPNERNGVSAASSRQRGS